MSENNSVESRYLDQAEEALSRKMSRKLNGKKEEKKKIPPAYLLVGSITVLVVVLAVQFLFSGDEEIFDPIVPPEVLEQFSGQLNAFSEMVENYEMQCHQQMVVPVILPSHLELIKKPVNLFIEKPKNQIYSASIQKFSVDYQILA